LGDSRFAQETTLKVRKNRNKGPLRKTEVHFPCLLRKTKMAPAMRTAMAVTGAEAQNKTERLTPLQAWQRQPLTLK
jgi:hypothetical protein